MIKTNVLAFLATVVALTSCAENKKKEETPQKVITSFQKKFPNAKKVGWEKENDKEWEAEFKSENVNYSANFSNSGNWLETEHHIKTAKVPKSIKTILSNNFEDYEIEASEISETSNGKFYEFEIEVGENNYEVKIDEQGNLTKKLEEEEGEEEESDEY